MTDTAAAQRHTLRVLVVSQALGGVGTAAGIAVSSLVAEEILGGPGLAGLAQAASTVGAAAVAFPLALVAARGGRRPALATGYAVGLAGAVLALLAVPAHSFGLLLVGALLFGSASAANLQARYAAADLAPAAQRGRAIGLVLAALTVGAVAGPNLVDPVGGPARALGLPRLAGPYLLSALAFAAGALVVSARLRPDPLQLSGGAGAVVRPSPRAALREVAANPVARLGLTAMAVSHAVMVGVMSMTPVHMHDAGAALRVIGIVISVHIAGMYAFSPGVGWLADRLGRMPLLAVGASTLVLACALAGTAPAHGGPQLTAGLFLLGLGWSFGLVAGSSLLVDAVAVERRAQVQGAGDLVQSAAGGLAGLLSGLVVAAAGYAVLAAASALLVAPLVLAALRLRRSSPGPAAEGVPSGA